MLAANVNVNDTINGGVLRRGGSACGGMEGGFANMRHACRHRRTFLRLVRMSKFCDSWISSLSSSLAHEWDSSERRLRRHSCTRPSPGWISAQLSLSTSSWHASARMTSLPKFRTCSNRTTRFPCAPVSPVRRTGRAGSAAPTPCTPRASPRPLGFASSQESARSRCEHTVPRPARDAPCRHCPMVTTAPSQRQTHQRPPWFMHGNSSGFSPAASLGLAAIW